MKNKAWLLLFLLSFIWGSSFFLIKLGLELFTPVQLALLRIFIAGISLTPFLFNIPEKSVLPWKILLLIGLIGNVIPALLFAAAQQTVPSAVAGMLNSLQPIFTMSIAFLAFKHSVPPTKVWGIILGFFGSLFLLFSEYGNNDLSSIISSGLLIVLATFCYGLATNLIRHYCHHLPPLTITSISLSIYLIPSFIGILLLKTPDTITMANNSFKPIISVLLLGSMGTAFALVFFNQLIQLRGPLFASTVTYLIPIVAILWGVLDNEPLGLQQLIGMMIIFIGLRLSSRPEEKKRVQSTH
ncbi:DMT family transporter [Pleionea sediminis]|uniref:DMT family transporter n=1 Tax=Pleionea sediminis TaxID=2569479 RepID=UPI0013DE23DA|nr:DMT family transporter [Pleionea sediminis]